MHKPGSLSVLIVCDNSTLQWANSIRAFAEICLFRVTLTVLHWKTNAEDFISSKAAFDITILCLHGTTTGNSVYCIDTEIPDASTNRINHALVVPRDAPPTKHGLLVNMGCDCGNEAVSRHYTTMGYDPIIASPSSGITFTTALAWIMVFLAGLVEGSLQHHHEIATLTLTKSAISSSLDRANSIIESKQLKWGQTPQ